MSRHSWLCLHTPLNHLLFGTLFSTNNAYAFDLISLLNKLCLFVQYLENQMAVAMGGRIAEELIFGEDDITTGAGGDFQQVRSINLPLLPPPAAASTCPRIFCALASQSTVIASPRAPDFAASCVSGPARHALYCQRCAEWARPCR